MIEVPAMTLGEVISRLKPVVAENIQPLEGPYPTFTVFLSLSDGVHKARVFHASGDRFEEVWETVVSHCERAAKNKTKDKQWRDVWLRADWITSVQPLLLWQLRECLKSFKRNYFRFGLAFDGDFEVAFLETELNANAMLYAGNRYQHAVFNDKNVTRYARRRFGPDALNLCDGRQPVYMLHTSGAFCAGDGEPQLLYPTGRNAGRRKLNNLDRETLYALIQSGGRYLAEQVQKHGLFHYGCHPCFDRPINTYNALRHASSLYAMLEAWEVTGGVELMAAIQRGVDYLLKELVQRVVRENGASAAFVVDAQDEIKLGANALCILMLAKYTELTGNDRHLDLLRELAEGILFMQDTDNGGFVHVLHYPDLRVKTRFRIIYYDGEAAFALMRLFRLTAEPRYLNAVEKAFEHFIAEEYWRHHDHWLSYCVNELTQFRPRARYYRLAIQNVADHLEFVEKRVTTFPTLLELMMATRAMLERLQADPEHSYLLAEIDLEHFERALKSRAQYMLNGYFWPELAMFFQKPGKITGSFFIRHHGFRVRIDDVEHYLSGYVAYLKSLEGVGGSQEQLRGNTRTTPAVRRRFSVLNNFPVDIERLRRHYRDHIEPCDATPYVDGLEQYDGWAVTSADGSISTGVDRGARVNHGLFREGGVETPLCHGYLSGLLTALKLYGLSPAWVRIVRMQSADDGVPPFHVGGDAAGWRLHIPITTSQGARFEWLGEGGDIESVHLPADGRAWLVRVDVPHRFVIRGNPEQARTHLVMELAKSPQERMFSS